MTRDDAKVIGANGVCSKVSDVVLPSPMVEIAINDACVIALLDSGSAASLVSENWYLSMKLICKFSNLSNVDVKLVSANGAQLDVLGSVKFKVRIHKFCWKFSFWVIKNLSCPIILGAIFLLILAYC